MHLLTGFPTLLAAAPPPGAEGCGDPKSGILLMLMIFGIFWFLVFRPQQKRMKQQQKFLENLQKGQEVVTQGGLIGKITGFKGPDVILEIQEKVRVRVLRANVSSPYPPNATQAGKASAATATDKASADKPDKSDKPEKPGDSTSPTTN